MRYFVGNKMVGSPLYELATLEECLNYFKDIEEIELDTETTGLDPHTESILCIQLGTPERQYVIDTSVVDVRRFKPLLEDPNKLFILQNSKFDLQFFFKYNIYIDRIYDTMLAECILHAGDDQYSVSLANIAKRRLDINLDKSVRADIHREGLSDRVIVYSAEDVSYLTLIKRLQMIDIKKWELEEVLNLENEVVKVFAKMEYHGVLIDADKWKVVAAKTAASLVELEEKLDEIVLSEPLLSKFIAKSVQGNLFGDPVRKVKVNWSSPIQKVRVLKALGISIESVADAELQKNQKKHPIVLLLISYSKFSKLNSSFGLPFLNFINKKTGRIHPSYKQIISTGRISVKKPNVNQIPSKGDLAPIIRSAFIPRPGYKFVGGDYSGMELALITEFSQDPLWKKTLDEGGNLHDVLCAATFNIPITDIKKPFPPKPDLTYRDVQKTVDFGLSYGMSKFKLSSTLQITEDAAQAIIDQFFSVVPKVKKFLDYLGNLGTSRGYIRTAAPFRRIRFFPQWEESMAGGSKAKLLHGEIERASKNMPFQGEPNCPG